MSIGRLQTLLLLLTSTHVAGCHRASDINTLSGPLKGRAETALQVLEHRSDFAVSSQHYISESGNLVILIGENHASTASQKQVAAVLGSLRDAGVLDAVLVEGSSGALPVGDVANRFSHGELGASRSDYWRKLLEWQRISGSEYFELQHPDIPAVGIEDRSAQIDYETASRADLKADIRIDELRLAAERLRAAEKAQVAAGHDASAAHQAIADLDTATHHYRELLTGASPRMKTLAVEIGDAEHKVLEYEALADTLRPLGEKRDADAKAVDAAQEALNRRADAFNEKVKGLGGNGTNPVTLGYFERQSLEQEKTAIETEDRRIEGLAQTVTAFDTEHSDDFAKLKRLSRELSEFESREVARQFDALNGPIDEARLVAYDTYFRAANRLRALNVPASNASTPESATETLAAVDRFFVDERKREEEIDLKGSPLVLRGRDVSMAANASQYLAPSEGKVVVAIVGYAHLVGMTEQLALKHISSIGGGLTGNRVNEWWEQAAWSKRRHSVSRIFATNKESTLILDRNWAPEMAAKMAWMEALDPHASMSMQKDERAAHVGIHLEDQQALFGEQVILHEPAVRSSEILEVWDRKVSRSLVTELSTLQTPFAYAFLGKPGDTVYTVETKAHGQQPLSSFMSNSPGSAAKYVVLFHEPDVELQSGIPVSAVWDALRPAGAGGGGKPPINVTRRVGAAGSGDERPKNSPDTDAATAAGGGHGGEPPAEGPWYQAGFWGDGDGDGDGGGDRPGLLRTSDPRRAVRNIAALDRQKRLDPKEINIIDQRSSLGQIPFTPRDGEAAGLVIVVARNEPEFRRALQEAGAAKKLQNKQIALITCGDAFSEATALREMALSAGAVMIWTPNRQISESAGNRLAAEVQQIVEKAQKAGGSFRDVDQLMNRAVGSLRRAEPTNAEFFPLTHSGSFVLVWPIRLGLGISS